jgi:hypothetical protein
MSGFYERLFDRVGRVTMIVDHNVQELPIAFEVEIQSVVKS